MKDFLLASGGVKARELRAVEVVASENSPDSQALPTEVFVGRSPEVATAENRKKLDLLVLAARAGRIARLTLPAVAFSSDDPDNSNAFEFLPEEFDQFATSFTGQPFQRDHSELQADRGGTVLRAWADPSDVSGRRWARADIELTEPWAIAGALNGTIDRFSFGAKAGEKLCSICKKEFFASMFSDGCREHSLGKSYGDQKARMLCKSVKGDEISAVVKPAYSGTGVAAIEIGATGKPHTLDIAAMRSVEEKEIHAMDMKKLAKLLGLPEEATEDQIEQEIAKLKTPVATSADTSAIPVPVAITNLLDLPANASVAECGAEIMARTYKPDSDADKQAIAELKASKRVDYWCGQGKFTPAERDWAFKQALKDPEGFELYASKKVPVIPSGELVAINAGSPAELVASELTPEDELFLKRHPKIKREDFIEDRKSERDRAAAIAAIG